MRKYETLGAIPLPEIVRDHSMTRTVARLWMQAARPATIFRQRITQRHLSVHGETSWLTFFNHPFGTAVIAFLNLDRILFERTGEAKKTEWLHILFKPLVAPSELLLIEDATFVFQ